MGIGSARLGQRFAGDRRGVHAQAEGLDQPAVGRNKVALLQQHDVAGHQIGGEYLHDLAVPGHHHLLRQQLTQRIDRPLGLVFLPESKDAVDQDDADDGNAQPRHALAGIEILGKKRQRRAHPQDEGEEVGELAGEAQQQALAPHLLDVVRAKLRQPALCLGHRQPRSRRVQAGEGLLRSEALDMQDGMETPFTS